MPLYHHWQCTYLSTANKSRTYVKSVKAKVSRTVSKAFSVHVISVTLIQMFLSYSVYVPFDTIYIFNLFLDQTVY